MNILDLIKRIQQPGGVARELVSRSPPLRESHREMRSGWAPGVSGRSVDSFVTGASRAPVPVEPATPRSGRSVESWDTGRTGDVVATYNVGPGRTPMVNAGLNGPWRSPYRPLSPTVEGLNRSMWESYLEHVAPGWDLPVPTLSPDVREVLGRR